MPPLFSLNLMNQTSLSYTTYFANHLCSILFLPHLIPRPTHYSTPSCQHRLLSSAIEAPLPSQQPTYPTAKVNSSPRQAYILDHQGFEILSSKMPGKVRQVPVCEELRPLLLL